MLTVNRFCLLVLGLATLPWTASEGQEVPASSETHSVVAPAVEDLAADGDSDGKDKEKGKSLPPKASPFANVRVYFGAAFLNPFNIKTTMDDAGKKTLTLEENESETAALIEFGYRRLCATYSVRHKMDDCRWNPDGNPTVQALLPADVGARLGFVVGGSDNSAATLPGTGEVSGQVMLGWPLHAPVRNALDFDAIVVSWDVDLGVSTDRKAQDIHGTYQTGFAVSFAEAVTPIIEGSGQAQARTDRAVSAAAVAVAKSETASMAERLATAEAASARSEESAAMQRAAQQESIEARTAAKEAIKEATAPRIVPFEAVFKLGAAIVDVPKLKGDTSEVEQSNGFPDYSTNPAFGMLLDLSYPLSSGAYISGRGAFYPTVNNPDPWAFFVGVEIDPEQLVAGITGTAGK